MKLSDAEVGDRVKLGITKSGHFPFRLPNAYRVIEVVVAGHNKAHGDTYAVWENCIPEFITAGCPNQSIRRIRRQQYRIPPKFRGGYHIDSNVEVEKIGVDTEMRQAAKRSSISSLPLLLACIGAGAALNTLSSQSTISNQPKKALL